MIKNAIFSFKNKGKKYTIIISFWRYQKRTLIFSINWWNLNLVVSKMTINNDLIERNIIKKLHWANIKSRIILNKTEWIHPSVSYKHSASAASKPNLKLGHGNTSHATFIINLRSSTKCLIFCIRVVLVFSRLKMYDPIIGVLCY